MSAPKPPFSLYIHIPYCVSKCPYCDFNSHVVSKIPESRYAEALARELELCSSTAAWHGRRLKSVFFGGGTPSTFSPTSIGEILEKAARAFSFEEEIEITLEANPGTADSAKFSGYRSCGVNRMSIGAQSFQPALLSFLGRVHTADETRDALRIVRRAGFSNFNLDLIYAIPGQSISDLKADLDEALSFEPPHVSAYNLTLEEGTPFHREYNAGRIRILPEEKEIAMAELVDETLAGKELDRYEISNYARLPFRSRHNVNYWQGGDYLGIGAGAHSYEQTAGGSCGHRRHNEKNPARYMEKIEREGRAVAGEEKTDFQTAAAEFMFLGLRMTEGIPVQTFLDRFGKKPDEFYPHISDWIAGEFMEHQNGRLRLTRRGLMVANSIFVNFV